MLASLRCLSLPSTVALMAEVAACATADAPAYAEFHQPLLLTLAGVSGDRYLASQLQDHHQHLQRPALMNCKAYPAT